MTPTKENLDLKKQNKKPQNPPWKINPEKNKTKKSPAIKTQTTKKKNLTQHLSESKLNEKKKLFIYRGKKKQYSRKSSRSTSSTQSCPHLQLEG